MTRIAVCDDDEFTLKELADLVSEKIKKYTDKYVVEKYTNGSDLLYEHLNIPFEIIFLDIDMPGITGFDIAEKIRSNFSNCYIVFVTSHSELVYESLNFQPFNFIRKNCNIPLEKSVDDIICKLMKHMKQNEKIVLEDYDYGRHSILIRDIIYIESDKHYIIFHTRTVEEPIRVRGTMNECEEKYCEYDFIRIHKQYIINLRYLSGLDNNYNEVLLGIINKRLPMSKRMKKEINEKYNEYLRTKA